MIDLKEHVHIRKGTDAEFSQFLWTVPENFPYFEGHFPGNPILPAVAFVDLSLYVIRMELQLEFTPFMKELKSAKLTGAAFPLDLLTIEIGLLGDVWRINWKRSGSTVADILIKL